MFLLGYNTNGLAHHRLEDALALLAELGYEAVSVTPDVGQLDLYRLDEAEVERVRRRADDLGLVLTIETGARFLMDPARKHYPTLLEDEPEARARRVEFLVRSLELAHRLDAPLVSLWSGADPHGARAEAPETARAARERAWSRLVEGLAPVLERAAELDVRVAFEPEPGMFVERPAGYRELVGRLGPAGAGLGLTLDVGHLLCTGDLPVAATLREHAAELAHVHLDDGPLGAHEHRMFGAGDLDLAETLSALMETGYRGVAAVELSRDSHRGARAAREAMQHLREALTVGP